MEKFLKPMFTMISDFLPGYKTYIMIAVAMGMAYCQMRGHHVFMNETWGMVGLSGAMFAKMGKDRDSKHPVGTPGK